MPPIIGIDLGMTNSVVAYVDYRTGRPRVIPDRAGAVLLPSVVSFGPEGTLIETDAARLLMAEADATIWSVEAAALLRALRQRAEAHFGEVVTNAVIAVPAGFDDDERDATRDAGRIAGFELVCLVDAATAAALGYGLHRRRNGVVAVYDLGGRTFELSLLKVADGLLEVLATRGHLHLGGDDFDRALVHVLLEDFRRRHEIDPSRDRTAMQGLRSAAETAKRRLSDAPRTSVTARILDVAYDREVTRDELERLIDPLVQATLIRCRMALLDAALAPADVDEVVLVGGATRVPLVRQRVEELFGQTPHTELNSQEVIAMGAAVQAEVLAGERGTEARSAAASKDCEERGGMAPLVNGGCMR